MCGGVPQGCDNKILRPASFMINRTQLQLRNHKYHKHFMSEKVRHAYIYILIFPVYKTG